MAAIIETEQLTKYYGTHRGIVEVDLRVEQGEVFGFLGPNGAGKTTMIRLPLDLIRPTRGRARVFGVETTTDPVSIHRRVGYLPVGMGSPRLPSFLRGLSGPNSRAFSESLPTAVWWGLGLGLYGFVMAVSSTTFIDELRKSPGILAAIRGVIPGADLTTTSGFLQFVFVDMGLALVGLAAATYVAGRASDETSGRLELLLATPLSRERCAVAGGVGAWMAIVVTGGLVAIGLGMGVALTDEDPVRPALGLVAVALYGAAMAGIGFAIGGLIRPALAAPTVVAVTIGMFLVQVLASALGLPDHVARLALSDHMGYPLVGSWDLGGIGACLALAVGGLLVGAWGLGRRDVG